MAARINHVTLLLFTAPTSNRKMIRCLGHISCRKGKRHPNRNPPQGAWAQIGQFHFEAMPPEIDRTVQSGTRIHVRQSGTLRYDQTIHYLGF